MLQTIAGSRRAATALPFYGPLAGATFSLFLLTFLIFRKLSIQLAFSTRAHVVLALLVVEYIIHGLQGSVSRPFFSNYLSPLWIPRLREVSRRLPVHRGNHLKRFGKIGQLGAKSAKLAPRSR